MGYMKPVFKYDNKYHDNYSHKGNKDSNKHDDNVTDANNAHNPGTAKKTFKQSKCLLTIAVDQEIHAHEGDKFADTHKKYGLIVEDNPIAALVAKTLFIAQGCEIDVAENGVTAIHKIQKHPYDFMLLDIDLPDINGFEVAKNIRLIEENTHRRAFIAGLTADAEVEKQHVLEAGIDLMLAKPLTHVMTKDLMSCI